MNNDLPLVSIVVASYNNDKYLEQCLESAVSQTYRNIELIVADDCSTDNSVEICHKVINNHPNVKIILISNPKNMGACNSLNNAIDNYCNGEYIKILDSDDWLYENAVEVLIDVFLRNGNSLLGLVYSRANTFVNHRISNDVIGESMTKEFLLSEGNKIPALTTMFTRDAFVKVAGYPKDGYIGDLELWLKIVVFGFEVKFIPDIVGCYRINSSSGALTANQLKMLFSKIEIRAKAARLSTSNNEQMLLIVSLKKIIFDVIMLPLKTDMKSKKFRNIWKFIPLCMVMFLFQPRRFLATFRSLLK